jgi:ubiquitin carboxyl-terminal hydrolase 9/24
VRDGATGAVEMASDDVEAEFPHAELARLDEMINRPRWVVPVLHNGELEILLDAVISMCKRGLSAFYFTLRRFAASCVWVISLKKVLTCQNIW